MLMSPLRWAGLGAALLGALLAAFLWFGYVGSQKKLAAADARLQADADAFHAIASVDRNTALVLKDRQARKEAQDKVHKSQKEKLHEAIVSSPVWASERVPDAVADSLR